MSRDNAGGPTIEGVPAVTWVREHRRELVLVALRALADQPVTGVQDPTRRDDVELSWIIGYNIDLFVGVLETGKTDFDERDAPDLVASAARRAAEGSPVESLLHDYQVALGAVWTAIAGRVGPDEGHAALALAGVVHSFMRRTTTLVLRGFEHVASRVSLGERDARFTVYSALLNGEHPQTAADRVGIELAPFYAVLKLHMDEAARPTGLRADDSTSVAGRNAQVEQHRRINAVQTVLDDHADGVVLAVVVETAGTALVPFDVTSHEEAVRRCQALGHAVHGHLGDGIVVAVEAAEPAGVPRAADVAEDVLLLARASGTTAGTWTLDDGLVSYQLTRPGPGRDRLERRLQALDGHPEWEETVRAYVAHGFDRRATAQALHLHPNSVDYRLSRFASTCGADPADPTERALVIASLAVRDVARLRPG